MGYVVQGLWQLHSGLDQVCGNGKPGMPFLGHLPCGQEKPDPQLGLPLRIPLSKGEETWGGAGASLPDELFTPTARQQINNAGGRRLGKAQLPADLLCASSWERLRSPPPAWLMNRGLLGF
jgi:hypothetical protein